MQGGLHLFCKHAAKSVFSQQGQNRDVSVEKNLADFTYMGILNISRIVSVENNSHPLYFDCKLIKIFYKL